MHSNHELHELASPGEIEARADTFRECFRHLETEIGRVFVGQRDLVDHLLICFFCQGHGLIEGLPPAKRIVGRWADLIGPIRAFYARPSPPTTRT